MTRIEVVSSCKVSRQASEYMCFWKVCVWRHGSSFGFWLTKRGVDAK